MVALFDNAEDLITENDRRYEENGSTQESVNVLGLNHRFTNKFITQSGSPPARICCPERHLSLVPEEG